MTGNYWKDQAESVGAFTIEDMEKARAQAVEAAEENPWPAFQELLPHRLYQLIVEEFDGTNYLEARERAYDRWIKERKTEVQPRRGKR